MGPQTPRGGMWAAEKTWGTVSSCVPLGCSEGRTLGPQEFPSWEMGWPRANSLTSRRPCFSSVTWAQWLGLGGSSGLGAGSQRHRPAKGAETLGLGRAGARRPQAPDGSGVQPARRGPSGPAARRSAGVSSRTRGPATGRTAAAPARRASGASGASTVSARVWGCPGAG